eukprot:336225-Rhodomonas_salina.1
MMQQGSYFWNQRMNVNTTGCSSETLQNFDSRQWKNEDSSSTHLGPEHSSHPPSLWASTTVQLDPVLMGVQPKMRSRDHMGEGAMRKNNKPVPWTAEDHEKFVAGLEQFGLQGRLGPGGAELMSVYMGDRS